MRRFLAVGFAGMVAGGMFGAPAFAQDKIDFALNWIPYGLHFGPVAAAEQGFYEENGIDITISRGYGSSDTLKRVATGANKFGISDAGAIIASAGDDLGVKIVASVLDKGADNVHFLKSSGISEPKDLEGRSLGAQAGESPLNLFPAFAEKAGFDAEKVTVTTMTPPAKAPSLITGQVDAIVTLVTEEPAFVSAAQKGGEELDGFLYSDYGVDRYSLVVITSDQVIEEDPDLVRRFVTATMQGYAWAMANPEEAADIFLEAYPESSRDLMLAQFEIVTEHMDTPVTREHGLGYIEPEKMAETVDLMRSYTELPEGFSADQLFTLDYLEEIHTER